MLAQAQVSGAIAEPPGLPTRQLVFDYFAGEIFHKADVRAQQFLLHTAYLPEMTTRIARELSGDPGTGELLASLTRNNYFVSCAKHSPSRSTSTTRCCATSCRRAPPKACPRSVGANCSGSRRAQMEQAGRIEDAVALYRECHDWSEMARLIEVHAAALARAGPRRDPGALGRGAARRGAGEASLDASTGRRRARRSSRRAKGRMLYEKAFELFRAARRRRGHAARRLGRDVRDPLRARRLLAPRSLDRACSTKPRRGGVRTALAARRRHGSPAACSSRSRCASRSGATSSNGSSARSPRRPAQADINLRMFVGLLAALTLMWTGLYRARRGADRGACAQVAAATGVTPFSLITLKNIETMYAMLTADGAACEKAMREGLDIAQATGVHTWTFQLLVWGYGGALGAGDLAARRRRSRSSSSRSPARPGASTFASTAISRPGTRCCART